MLATSFARTSYAYFVTLSFRPPSNGTLSSFCFDSFGRVAAVDSDGLGISGFDLLEPMLLYAGSEDVLYGWRGFNVGIK
jgi:hypothetical protein